ncbi:hypothetical protein [Planktotalea sp.]|uniref:hypothetical protein n=1 Tax=Planktotalea sp. TaxID=2029877 RepID=UPI003297BDBB
MTTKTQPNILLALWTSFNELPLWVRLWMVLWLIPLNITSLCFINEPMGVWVAVLANVAMLLNLPIMFRERRLSRTMALPHLPFWTPLVILIFWMVPDASTLYGMFLIALAATNIFSLVFDYIDAYRWAKGDRG